MAKKRKASGDYFGLSRLVSLILAILPTCWLLGALTRIKERKYVAGLLRLFVVGWNILYIADIIMMIWKKRILRILDV